VQKREALVLIGRNQTYKEVCKTLAPQNWKEVYSHFLLIVCEKPNRYFTNDLDYKCKGLIKALTKPCSEVNYTPKKKIDVVFSETLENFQDSSKHINIKQEALYNVFENETDRYLHRIMQLMIDGHNQSSIRRLTKNKLPSYEMTRAFKEIKEKVINEYERLCQLL